MIRVFGFLVIIICSCMYVSTISPYPRLAHVGQFVGCYQFDPNPRSLPQHAMDGIVGRISIGMCAEYCTWKVGSVYVGLINNEFKTCRCYDSLENVYKTTRSEWGEPYCEQCGETAPCGDSALAIYPLKGKTEEEKVSILLGTDHDVQLLNTTRYERKVLSNLSSEVMAVNYDYDRNEAFALTYNSVFRFPLALKSSSSPSDADEMSTYANCDVFTVDWVHGHVIWPVNHHYPEIKMVTLDGEEEQWTMAVMPKSHPDHFADMAVDPYASQLFWTTQISLLSCGLDGRNLKTLVPTLPAFVTSMALDLNLRRIYFCGHKDNSSLIFYTDYQGSRMEMVHNLTHEEGKIWDVDVFRSQVYFLAHVEEKGSSVYRIEDFRNPLRVTEVLFQSEEVFHMKLVHRELQTVPPNRVDACTTRGCAHHCVVEQHLARCRCVSGFTLAEDMISCREVSGGPNTVDVTVLGIICVLSILLAAGVLMCMVDKMWSKVHPKVVLIYSRRPRGMERNDQLIIPRDRDVTTSLDTGIDVVDAVMIT